MSVKLVYHRPTGLTSGQWNKVANQAVKVVKSVTPVDTGRARSSWEETRKTRRSVTVTGNEEIAPYLGYLNDGTPKMAPRDMVGKAKTILEEKANAYKK